MTIVKTGRGNLDVPGTSTESSMMTSEVKISVDHLTKEFDSKGKTFTALDDINITIKVGS